MNKASLMQKIASLANDKTVEGIADLRDESDSEGMRIVVEISRSANPAVVGNNLFKRTSMQQNFPANLLAIVDEGRQPQQLTLKAALRLFLDFRFLSIRKRSTFELQVAQERQHVVGPHHACQPLIPCLAPLRWRGCYVLLR